MVKGESLPLIAEAAAFMHPIARFGNVRLKQITQIPEFVRSSMIPFRFPGDCEKHH